MTAAGACSVVIPSHGRPDALARCLRSLARQTRAPDEVLVVWQADDAATRDAAQRVGAASGLTVRPVHARARGVVPAENAALAVARGAIVLLIDDDAAAPDDWVARHLAHYAIASTGAVGGPAVNHHADGTPFPTHARRPIGRLTWYGKAVGNMHDHPPEWRSRQPIEVDHLVGYNCSFRRTAIDRFEDALEPYWQNFELDACLQARHRGYRVVFDFANVVDHYPTNPAYAGGRAGDLQVKIYNAAYNRALILSKHSPWHLRWARRLYLQCVGSVAVPGLAALPVATLRYGRPLRELRILWRTMQHHRRGWSAGRSLRRRGRQ